MLLTNMEGCNKRCLEKKTNIAFLLLHFFPSPENPALQVQINEGVVAVRVS